MVVRSTKALSKKKQHRNIFSNDAKNPGELLEHLADRVWKLFSSVKFAIIQIIAISLVCVIGMIFAQAPVEISSSPQDYAGWIDQTVRPTFGAWTDFLNWLQFFTIFSSWYFRLLLVVLAVSIFVCTWNRIPSIWRNFAHPQLRRSDRFYINALEKTEFYTNDSLPNFKAALKKRHFRVRTVTDSDTQVVYVYANKNTWATLSTFVFHACLVGILLSGVISNWRGFGSNNIAEKILPGPVYAYLQNIAGFSYPQELPDGENGLVYPIGTTHNIEYHVNNFVANFNPQTGQPTDYYTDLSVLQDGKQVAQGRIRVNSPITYQGVTFHQASFGMYAWVTLKDQNGLTLFNQKEVLQYTDTYTPSGSSTSIPIRLERNIPFGTQNQTITVAAADVPNEGWLVFVQGYDASGNEIFRGTSFEGQTTATSNGYQFTAQKVSRDTVLLVTKDSGAPLLWPICLLLVLSLCITLYFPQKRMWARIDREQVRIGAMKEHFCNIHTDLVSIKKQLHTPKVAETFKEMKAAEPELAVSAR